jgi:hypothetical protein
MRVSSACWITGRLIPDAARRAVVADGDRTGALQSSKIGKHSAFAGVGRGRDREHIDHRCTLGLLKPGDPFGRIDDRRSVRHAAHGSESASSSGSGTSRDALFVALTRFAQVNVEIDETRSHDQAARIEGRVSAAADLVRGGDLRDVSVTQQHVHGCIQPCGGIDDATAFDQERGGFRFIVCHC